MSRIVSVWLPRWPIFRALAAQAKHPSGKQVDPDRPFVLTVVATGGPRIAALNAAAEILGLATGDLLADARAKAEFLQVRDADPAADDAALRRLALWATRYTPTASPWNEENGADGFFLDISGAAHLFGGEEKLIADLSHRLEQFGFERFGLSPRLAVADTPGMAWALSHFHPSSRIILPPSDIQASENEATESKATEALAVQTLAVEALADLPIAALRLEPATRRTLRRLGFKRVGALIDAPRAPLAARFEK